MPDLNTFVVPTPDEVRDDFLRVIRNGLIARGVPSPNVSQGSDWWVLAEAVRNQIVPGLANASVKADSAMPDTANGADLDRVAGIYGIVRRPTQGAVGFVNVSPSTASFVTAGTQLVDVSGKRYAVRANTALPRGVTLVGIEAVDPGADTNLAAGTSLAWVAPPAYCAPTATVGAGGLTGGIDDETDGDLRDRLLAHLRTPPAGGNPQFVAELAEAASGAVERAFVYPGLDGPATFGVCIVGALTYDATLGYTRGLSPLLVADVAAYVAARMPAHANMTLVTPTDVAASSPCVDTDVSIGISLPLAASAGGPGGGWLDAAPWPQIPGGATRVSLVGFLDALTFTINASEVGCVPGLTRIAWYDPTLGTFRVATVTAVANAGVNTCDVTLDPSQPFAGIASGDYVCPASESLDAYGKAWVAAMAQLGPGQWTTDANRLPRAARRPLTSQSWPSDLTATQLRAVSDVGAEVLDVSYLYRSSSTPGVPASTSASPKILVPRRLGFYQI